MKKAIAMKCNQEQWDSIKGKLVGCEIERITTLGSESYLVNCFKVDKTTNLNFYCSSAWTKEIHETWNEQIFLEACGIKTEKIFKGSELQWFNTDEEKWMDCCHKYRLKPDYSKEIEELERQIEILKNK